MSLRLGSVIWVCLLLLELVEFVGLNVSVRGRLHHSFNIYRILLTYFLLVPDNERR